MKGTLTTQQLDEHNDSLINLVSAHIEEEDREQILSLIGVLGEVLVAQLFERGYLEADVDAD